MNGLWRLRPKHGRVVVVVGMVLLMLCGCAMLKKGRDDAAPAESAAKDSPVYYDFGDVLVPREMKLDKNASFVFRTPGMSAGVLSMKGRVDGNSLIAFFEANMANDNWSMVSAFKSYRTIMLFKKENRWCVINITEKEIYTHLEIWVSPTVEGAPQDIFKSVN